MLLEEFLAPMGLTQRELADGIRVPYQRVNELVNGRRGVTPHTAVRLAKWVREYLPLCSGEMRGGAIQRALCWQERQP